MVAASCLQAMIKSCTGGVICFIENECPATFCFPTEEILHYDSFEEKIIKEGDYGSSSKLPN